MLTGPPQLRGHVADAIDPSQDMTPGCLHELFEARVDAAGDALALICGDLELSYAELEAQSNRLAHHLRALGAAPGVLVGLCLNRSERPIIAILACLKAGAAYVPIDPTLPDERIRYIAAEAAIALLICEQENVARLDPLCAAPTLMLDASLADIASRPATRLARAQTGATPADLCYVIYTSGTSGRPKGVMTEHRNAHHFVRAFNAVCTTVPSDRIYQGFSLGFDGSVEEIWMALSNGAALVVGERGAPRFGNDLARFLAAAGVTYFSTVPTMLSTMTEDVPSLRQLVVSGEVCPPELVARWARSGRLMLNVYGPTEATVNTTAKPCLPGQAITVGRPIAGYEALVLDGDMNPLPPGEMGELFIGGAGVARGYLNNPELTARQFVTSSRFGRLYRSGDLAAINGDGDIEYFGRIDDQVKIRGYRVELSEIASVLLEQENIVSATVAVREQDGVPVLAAYVVAKNPAQPLRRCELLAELRRKLPAYMVPAYLDVLSELPTLATGKVDRKRLPAPVAPLLDEARGGTPPANPLEQKIAETWARIFGIDAVSVEQDFFLDLGGHSLVAAQMVALLRDVGLHVPVRAVYAFPSVRALAAHLAEAPAPEAPAEAVLPLRRNAGARIGALQACLILVTWWLFAAPLLFALPIGNDMLQGRLTLLQAVLILMGFYVVVTPVFMMVGICAKWLIIGRYQPGRYPLWGHYYLRWWLVNRLQTLFGAGLLIGTPLLPVYYRLMGAQVGRDCALDSALVSAWDLISIGDDTSIGADTQLLGARVEDGYLILGRVEIGRGCFVGAHSALGLNVRMGDDARLDDQSLLPDGTGLPPGEQRRGSPGKALDVPVPLGVIVRPSLGRKVVFTAFAWLLGNLLAPLALLPALAFLPIWLLAYKGGHLGAVIWMTVIFAPVLVAVSCLWIAVLKAVLLRRSKPGVYSLYSPIYLRHWLAAGLMRTSRALLLPVFTTLYLPPWMRLLGARIGKYAEMSTIWSFMPDLLDAGKSAFFADGCMFGGKRMFAGRFEIGTNHVGNRSFVGNGAILPTGAGLGEGCLLGVLSAPPSPAATTRDNTDWLGSPAFQLPNRQKVGGFSEEATYLPSHKLYAQRAVVDALRILIPTYTILFLGLGSAAALLYGYMVWGLWAAFALLPLLGMLDAAIGVAIVVGLKWAVMGRFKPVIVPLWSPYVWFNEMVNGAYEFDHGAGRSAVPWHAHRRAAAAFARLPDRPALLHRHQPVFGIRSGSNR